MAAILLGVGLVVVFEPLAWYAMAQKWINDVAMVFDHFSINEKYVCSHADIFFSPDREWEIPPSM